MSYIVSIIVPTKNRYQYLKYLIALIDSFKLDELELVIQDNSDNNGEIVEYLRQFSNENIRYFHTNEKLSMSGNADKAVLNSTGEYVCFIGDDDGICRNIIDCVKWMKTNGIDTLRTGLTMYTWDDYNKSIFKNNLSQTLRFKKTSPQYFFVDPVKELEYCLNIGFQNLANMPLLYTGIVKREILDEVYKIGKTYFPGGSPDISNGVVLCFYSKSHAIINTPIVISGTSLMTGGGILRKKGRTTNLEDVDFISQSVKDNWEPNIPRIWSGRLAWPESGIKALKYVKQEDFLKKMNYNYMFASFSFYYKKYFTVAFRFAPSKIKFLLSYIKIFISVFFRVSKNRLQSFFDPDTSHGMIIVRNVKSIIDAENFLIMNYDKKTFQCLN
jgi:glycosyltransferase involved in cell wall biosynthesis